MAIEVVQRSSFTFDLFGDGSSNTISLDIGAQNIRSLVSVQVNSQAGVTATGTISGRRLTITFSAPFNGLARVFGEYVQ